MGVILGKFKLYAIHTAAVNIITSTWEESSLVNVRRRAEELLIPVVSIHGVSKKKNTSHIDHKRQTPAAAVSGLYALYSNSTASVVCVTGRHVVCHRAEQEQETEKKRKTTHLKRHTLRTCCGLSGRAQNETSCTPCHMIHVMFVRVFRAIK